MFADSEHDASMLYAVGMFVPDAFIYLRLNGRAMIVMSDLEIDRARAQAPHCKVLSLTKYKNKAKAAGMKAPGTAQIIQTILREQDVRQVLVPGNFPLGLAEELRSLRIVIKAKSGNFFPERETKSAEETRHISAALRITEAGMAAGIAMLRASRIGKGGRLMHNGAPLTSERLRGAIDSAISALGGLAAHTIVAGGIQACDPHEGGHGPLRANELIILDVFPRSQKSGYFGDMTRTVVRGKATEAARRLYHTVHQAQQLAFRAMKAGANTARVHNIVAQYFSSQGYETGRSGGRMQGFFHGTGHGLGLEIHEAPRVGQTSTGELRAGHVVTVEPGLYYPDIGGVRIEDVALVTKGGPKNLTRFEKVLEV